MRQKLVVTLALLAAMAPAAAADRWWTYIGGCASADWLGMPAGSTNAQGQVNCWAATNGGLSGQSMPTGSDKVFLQTSGSSDISVSFARPGRSPFAITVDELTLAGTGTGFSGLTLAADVPAATMLQVDTLWLGLGGRGQVQQGGGRVVVTGQALLGVAAENVGRYSLSGGRLEVPGSVSLGLFGRGEYTQTGGQASVSSMGLAAGSGSSASAVVSGGVLTVGSLDVGSGGAATMSVSGTGSVNVSSLEIGSRGRVVLDGGTLAVSGVGGTGTFEWRSGTLQVGTAGGTTSLGSSRLLPSAMVLAPQQALKVTGTLAVGSGLLALQGGSLQAGQLTLGGGTLTVVGGGAFDVGSVAQLSGHGTVLAAVGGGPQTAIVASGGVLTLGQANRDDGFDFGGMLTVQGQQVVLLDRNGASLGLTTVLSSGGRLASANGLLLGAGSTLSFGGQASIEGAFTHQGVIAPLAGTGASSLTFFDDVSGPGSFAGHIVFRGLYAPGTGAAAFGGGTLRVDGSGALVLGLDGLAPGSFSRLSGIGTLDYGGGLHLAFGSGFALPDAGATVDLLDFERFAGFIDPARVVVTGVDPARVDVSQLAIDGTLHITPVPEPGTGVMLLGGIAGLLAWRRARRVVAAT